ncbi:hypothetical protein HYW76_05470 [Candidatus Pacearchaeota archaeon]|nr:hypothetical protein [Candidatus Pacearchaeota archaeon]
MAVMGRKKQGVKQLIELRRAQTKELAEQQRQKTREMEKPVSEEEHQKRIKMLKEMGILK